MRKIYIFYILVLVILVFNGGFPQPSKYEGKIVRKIELIGLKNIDPDDLIDVMITEEGFPLRASEIKEDIKAVFKRGQLHNVIVEVEEYRDGVRVRFICKERTIIKDIQWKGVDELSNTELSEIIPVKEGDVLRINMLEKSIKVIKKKYEDEGFFNAMVKYDLKKDIEDENVVDVVFIIDEGEEIKVAKISILGARKIPSDKLIDAMETEEEGWFRDGTFKKEAYEQDKGKIIGYYKERGYLDAEILEDVTQDVSTELAYEVLSRFQNLQTHYFNAAEMLKKKREYEKALEKYIDTIYVEEIKNMSSPISEDARMEIEKLLKQIAL